MSANNEVSQNRPHDGAKWDRSTFSRILFGPEHEPDKNKTSEKIKRELRRYYAEFHGTFILVLIHAGVRVVAQVAKPLVNLNEIEVAMASGLSLAGLIYSLGQVSGAHFNPVVTMAFTLRGVFAPWRIPIYWVMQFAGALVAGGVLRAIFGNVAGLGAPSPFNGTIWQAFVLEILCTYFFLTVILSTAEDHHVVGPNAALAVGFTLAALTMTFGPVVRVGLNPFRSLGPAVVSGYPVLGTIWPYVVGPIIGMLGAVFTERLLTSHRTHKRKAAEGQGTVASQVAPKPED